MPCHFKEQLDCSYIKKGIASGAHQQARQSLGGGGNLGRREGEREYCGEGSKGIQMLKIKWDEHHTLHDHLESLHNSNRVSN